MAEVSIVVPVLAGAGAAGPVAAASPGLLLPAAGVDSGPHGTAGAEVAAPGGSAAAGGAARATISALQSTRRL